MKIRVVFRMLLAVAISAFMIFWVFKSLDSTELGTTQQMSDRTVSSKPVSAAAAKALKQNEKERILITFNAIEGSNQPINFWGKVLDQDDQPIAGVKVRFSYSVEHGTMLAVTWGRQENRENNVITDSLGTFYIGGMRGHVLEIVSLTKVGYLSTKRGVLNYDYYGSTSEGRFNPSQDAPVLFAMVEEAKVKGIAKYGDELGTSLDVIGNGIPIRWNLRAEKPDPNGELQVTFKREPVFLNNPSELLRWDLKIELIDGGIMEASSTEVIYRAPEAGYLPVTDYPKLEQRRGYPKQAFYFRTADKKYGRLHLELYENDEGESARLYIQSWLNSSGGRLLEAGPNR